jgi:hypothetical protein
MQQMAMAIAQNMGPDWQNDEALVAQMQQLSELASQSDVDNVSKEQKQQSI